MIYSLQRVIITLLVFLQMLAPLVHAHSGLQDPSDGIHLPGLELIDSSHTKAFIDAVAFHGNHDGAIFSVSSGIKHNNGLLDDPGALWIMHSNKECASTILLHVNRLHHHSVHRLKSVYSSRIPRAPPLHLL